MKKSLIVLIFIFFIGNISNAQNSASGKNNPDFFPIAVWAQNPVNAAAYRENGINLFVSVPRLDQTQLDLLKKANMKAICRQNSFGLSLGNDTTIYGWMHGDEPDNAQMNRETKKYDPCIDPAKIVQNYENLKQSDPSRPVYLNVGRGVAYTNWVGRGACRGKIDMYKISNNGYLKACDIASFDIYPVNSTEKDVKDSLWYVAKGIDNLLQWSDNTKPVWCWIESTKIGEGGPRKPTPSEVKSEVWMALIHGASGFGYFCHSFGANFDDAALLHDSEMIKGVKAINEQVTSLAAVLNTPSTTGYATVTSNNKAIPVDIMTKKLGNTNYIFAVAMKQGTTTAAFSIKKGKKIEVIGENRMITVKKGNFSDDFSNCGVHLYKIIK